MIDIKITALDDLTQSYNLICGVFKQKTDILQFKDKTKYFELQMQNSVYLSEDDTFESQQLDFESVILKGEDILDFKSFYRWENRTFLLKIKKNGKTRFTFVKRNEETVTQMGYTGKNETETFELSFITMCYFINMKILQKEIVYPVDPPDTKGYYNNNLSDTPNGYIYNQNAQGDDGNFTYPLDGASETFFPIDLPYNNGDKKAYLKVECLEWLENPSWGMDTQANDTKDSYISENLLRVEEEVLVVNSFPLLAKIETHFKNTGKFRRNVRQLRDYSRKTFLTIPKDKETHQLVFTDVTKVRVTVYEQFRNF